MMTNFPKPDIQPKAPKAISGSDGMPLLVVAAIIQREGRYLLTQRLAHKQMGGLWEFPGGKVQPWECPRQALQREIREELNIRVMAGQTFETVYYEYSWGPVLILAYHCDWLEGNIENLEVADHRWLLPTEFHQLEILPADTPFLKCLQGL